VAVNARGEASDGELGKSVYTAKIENADGIDIFIPTTNYVRMGVGANLGFGSKKFDIGGKDTGFEWGLKEQFAVGWNLSSMFRTEIGWGREDMRFAGDDETVLTGRAEANINIARASVIMDLARRYVLRGDVTYRKRLVPFIGLGASGGYADFEDADAFEGHSGWVAGGHGMIGLGLAFSETNALDVTVMYEILYGKDIAWHEDAGYIGNAGVTLSWRSSF
jgi:hypothetical protein